VLSSCIKDPGISPIKSVFSFSGSPGNCSVATPSGIYIPGTALTASNTVTIQVNVTKLGSYNITTGIVNGYIFSGKGVFAAAGIQTVVLTGNGTPIVAGIDSFTPTADGVTGCTFNVIAGTGSPAVFTYSGAPGACTVATVNGTYGLGTPLIASNTVNVQVNVTAIGSYTISTNTVGGMTFSKSGNFASTGNQTVTLNGTGTPNSAGAKTFTVGTNGCTFVVNVAGPAVFTLSGAPGACTGATVNGTYGMNIALTASNTVIVQVNVTTIGSYTISTNTVGGMTFSKSGIFTTTGNQTVTLNGTGTPTTAGNNTLTVGTGGCTFVVNVAGPAVYSFSGAPGACTVATVTGTYTVGNPLTASNTVTVEVNVATIGAYTITTSTGGMTFSKTGVFSVTGIQTVTLSGSGTPATSGANNFTAGTGGCTFVVTVAPPTSPCSGLVDGKFVMTGRFTLDGISFAASLGSQFQVSIEDLSTFVQIDVFFPGPNPPTAGTYSVGTVSMHCLASDFTDWVATSGSVYVSVDAFGDTSVEFCNVNFRGTPLFGGTVTSTGAGKMVF
jgi:hypothetical protein